MSKFLKANEIINKGSESRDNFHFLSKMQIFSQITSTTKNGKPYLVISMRDITGNISNIRKWIDNDDDLEKYREILKIGNVVEINGEFNKKYKNVIIISTKEIDPKDYELKEFVDLPFIDEDLLIKQLFDTISKIQNKYLKNLIENIFNDEEIKSKFFECPSAIKHHHPYRCGNLEHTIGMINVFRNFEDFYNRNTELNVDLIYAGIILHDIGKIYEYKIYNGIPMKTSNSLIGHHTLGFQLVSRFINEISDFPNDLKNRILHIILSHHGRKEWGSPVEPQFSEAEIVHYLDMIDSRFKSQS